MGSDYLTIWKQRKIPCGFKDEQSEDEQQLDEGEANNGYRLNDQSEDDGMLNGVGWDQWQW